MHGERRIDLGGVDARGHHPILQRQRADHRLERTGGAERVTGCALGRAAGDLRAEHVCHGAGFGFVVARRAGTMKVDVFDVTRGECGGLQRLQHGGAGATALRMWGRHVVRVARFADPEQQHRIRIQARPGALEQRERGGFADGNTVARDIEGPAGRARHQLQGVKAIERGEAQRVDPADERGIDQPRLDGAPGRGEHLGARGARARDHHGRA